MDVESRILKTPLQGTSMLIFYDSVYPPVFVFGGCFADSMFC